MSETISMAEVVVSDSVEGGSVGHRGFAPHQFQTAKSSRHEAILKLHVWIVVALAVKKLLRLYESGRSHIVVTGMRAYGNLCSSVQ